jgi:hypothetical protein
MIVIHLSNVVAMMAASDERCTHDLDFPWPLHKALVTLALEGKTWNAPPPWEIEVGLVDDAGTGVPGLDAVVRELYRAGILIPDVARRRRLVAAEEGLAAARRQLLCLSADAASGAYRAARLWATESLTVSKNLATALWSLPPTYWVSPPKPRQSPPAVR